MAANNSPSALEKEQTREKVELPEYAWGLRSSYLKVGGDVDGRRWKRVFHGVHSSGVALRRRSERERRTRGVGCEMVKSFV
ncbi:unnamed protein product [Camellia sinensis]